MYRKNKFVRPLFQAQMHQHLLVFMHCYIWRDWWEVMSCV